MINEAKRLKMTGEYYFSGKLKQIAGMKKNGVPVINLGIGNPDMDAPDDAVQTLARWVNYNGVHGYQPYRGLPEFRKAIADFYRDHFNTVLDYDEGILPISGSKEGIMHITQSYMNEGDTVLVPDPGYPAYESAAAMVNAHVIKYAVRPEKYRPIDIDFISSVNYLKLLWLNFPHMPTGALADKVMLKKLVDLARKKNFLIVYDNAYARILNPDPLSILGIPGAGDVCLELNSLSKTYNMAGWRVGWICGKPQLIDPVFRYISNVNSGMFLPIQKAAAAALRTDELWLEKMNAEYRTRKETVYEMLRFLGCTFQAEDSGGLFVWARIPAAFRDGEDLSDQLLEKTSVFVTPGFVFGERGKDYIRISLCAETWQFKEALMRIIEAFGKKKQTRKQTSIPLEHEKQ